MIKTASITALLCALVTTGAFSQDLPDGEGKDVVVKGCTGCHDADNFTSKRKTKEGWKTTVDTMIAYGAELSDEQSEIIVKYLAKNFGNEAKLGAAAKR